MRPTLFTIGPLPIRSYGVMIAIAFLVAMYIAIYRAKRKGVSPKIISDLGLYILISGLLGARIFHVIQHIGDYDSFIDVFKIWKGGLAYYGGFISAFVVAVIYLRKEKLSVGKIADIIAPPLALGMGIARIGCFLAGCCFGKPTSLPWGVTFPEGSLTSLMIGMQKVHPTQLYELIASSCTFVVLLILEKYMRFPGQLFISFVIIYSVHRFFVDFLRYYSPEEHIGILATSQVISIIAFAVALALMVFFLRQQKNECKTV